MKRIIITVCICAAWAANLYAQYPYTLKKCLEEGLANNYSIRITRNEEQITHNNATPANAGYLPTVDLSAGYSGTLDNTDSKTRSTGTTTSERSIYDQTLKAGLDVNWTLFDGFNISTTYKKLKELERQGETNTRITLEDFIAGLTAEYYNYVQQEIRLKNFRYAVSLSKERLRIVEERYHIGNFSRLDYQQAKVDFNADSAQYMKQQDSLDLRERLAAVGDSQLNPLHGRERDVCNELTHLIHILLSSDPAVDYCSGASSPASSWYSSGVSRSAAR